MIRNPKRLGLVIVAVLALGALTAQGASAAVEHEFRSDGAWTVGTGEVAVNLQVGAAGTIACSMEVEDQSGGKLVGEEYLSDTLTVTAHFTGCTFGGSAATVNTNHCAFVLDSDTTTGNAEGGEHANVEIECAEAQKIEIHTSVCTVTVAPQLVKHAIQYEPGETSSSIDGIISGKNVVTGKLRNTAAQPVNGCLTFPTGAIGTASGNGTTTCFTDEGSVLSGTEKTTPTNKTVEGGLTKCSVK